MWWVLHAAVSRHGPEAPVTTQVGLKNNVLFEKNRLGGYYFFLMPFSVEDT